MSIIPIISNGQISQFGQDCICDTSFINYQLSKEIFSIEERPNYSGGDEALIEYLKENIKFESGIKGKISIRYIINCKGKACGFHSINKEGNISNEIQIEILKIFKKLELFEPARQRGRKVDCLYIITIELNNGRIINF